MPAPLAARATRRLRHGMKLIFVVALISTLGSLYYGYFGDPIANLAAGDLRTRANGFEPCTLCRYARILKYPLLFIAATARIKKDNSAVDFIRPFVALGIPLEVHHYLLQKFPIATTSFCTAANPCNALSVDYFGFITIPFLCLLGFLLITIFALIIKSHLRRVQNLKNL